MPLLLALAASCVLGPAPIPPQDRMPSLTGNIRLHEAFQSQILGNRRTLRVYLPPNYDLEPNRRFPVMYLHDGQNLFDGATSFIPNMEWRVDETAEALIRAKLVEPIIVVGIDNGGMQRANEFLPTRAQPRPDQPPYGGQADRYAEMLIREIKPLIDRTYRTKSGREFTGTGGSSFGGVVSLYLGLRHPDVFSKLAVVSPSVWWDDRVVVRYVDELPRKLPLKIWLDMGGAEGPGSLAEAGKLHAALVRKGWRDGHDLAYFVDGHAQHNEAAWARRVGPILMFLFGR
jgi:predicted alpha/beta superfamily hydrolase